MKWKLSFLELSRLAIAALTVVLLLFMVGGAADTELPLQALEAVTVPQLSEGETQKTDGRMLRRLYALNP